MCVCASEDFGIDFEAEVAVITTDVPMGATPDQALKGVRLLMLVNDVSLRNLIPAELAKGFGFFQSKPATSFAPVAVTPDELGEHWREGRVHRPMIVHWNGKKVGQPDAGTDMVFHFGQLIAHAAKTRNLRAGSIVGSGTVSNKDAKRGYCCIAEKRCLETIEHGAPQTEFMKYRRYGEDRNVRRSGQVDFRFDRAGIAPLIRCTLTEQPKGFRPIPQCSGAATLTDARRPRGVAPPPLPGQTRAKWNITTKPR